MKRYAMGFFKGAPAMFEQADGDYVKWSDAHQTQPSGEAATAQPAPDLHTVIRETLANHRLTHQHEEPDSGLLLVDALSCGEPTITKGKEELDLLADAIWFDVCAALTNDQPNEVICPSCNGTGDAYIPRDGRMAARCDACKGRGVVYDQP